MNIYRYHDGQWSDAEVVEDAQSNVFHKGIAWRDGLLTIGAMPAKLVHWTKSDGAWKDTLIWEQSWGGKFDRLRDIEIGDLDGDGKDELAIATHDVGVVAVGDEAEDGTWTFQEFDPKDDTFVHEVEIGDVDGDGKPEFYVTPSDRNKASGVSQPGGVARYDYVDGTYKRSQVVHWEESHAKEILVADIDGDGTDELYVAKEGHVEHVKGKAGKRRTKLVDPAQVVRMVPNGDGTWREEVFFEMAGEEQCRFLAVGDVDHDGKNEMVAAGKGTGLWVLQPGEGGVTADLVDKNSGGFEHATHLADLDGDGKLEIYAASEKRGFRELRQYVWTGSDYKRTKIDDIPDMRITWNVQDGVL